MTGIAGNIERIQKQIEAAEERSGRKRGAVRLIAVSKTKPVSDILSAYADGMRDFGENYVQEVLEKAPALPADARLHFIGHLQTNKIGKLLGKVAMIHSVDSLHLADALEKQLAKREAEPLPVLLEVNIAREESKFGFAEEEVLPAVLTISRNCPHLQLKGLMTSAPPTEDAETNRPYFRAMKRLLDAANEQLLKPENACRKAFPESAECTNTGPLTELSMGMSGDYLTAVEEGATMVRIGTAIFGARDYAQGAAKEN